MHYVLQCGFVFMRDKINSSKFAQACQKAKIQFILFIKLFCYCLSLFLYTYIQRLSVWLIADLESFFYQITTTLDISNNEGFYEKLPVAGDSLLSYMGVVAGYNPLIYDYLGDFL